MEHFQLTLFSVKFNVVIDIGYTIEQSQIINEFISIFNAKINLEKQTINIDYKHKNTKELQKELTDYISNYKNILPQIQQINKYFKIRVRR